MPAPLAASEYDSGGTTEVDSIALEEETSAGGKMAGVAVEVLDGGEEEAGTCPKN